MSRPKYYWYPYVVNTIRRYNKGLKENTTQNLIARKAIEDTIKHTLEDETGEERMRVVTLAYLNSSHTIEGAALKCHMSATTAKRIAKQFIYEVASRMGFIKLV